MEVRNKSDNSKSVEKVHPWRKCGKGQHLVREHTGHTHPSKKNPSGTDATWHEHCANNPSGKDELSFAEIKFINNTYFADLSGPPTPYMLTKLFRYADKYDAEIRGWVQYWNDIFKLGDPLDADIVKALIATESSFDPQPEEHPHVYGLMQLRGDTHQYLSGKKHDLRNHFVCVSTHELLDPSINICGGVRWLFRKKETAAGLLKRRATWEETIEDYKGILVKRLSHQPFNPKPMEDFHKYYEILKQE